MSETQTLPYIGKHDVHEYGHVILEKCLGDELDIVNNARVSFDGESGVLTDRDKGLLNFLMRERHSSPFEAVVFRFDVRAPLFVIREWQRHRIGSFNEESARYSVIKPDYYVHARDYVREQHGKPGAYYYETVEDDALAERTIALIDASQRASFDAYHSMLEEGIAKEVARTVLPVGMYSRMKWTVNLRSLLNFLSLRHHEHAQREIRDFAIAVEDLVTSQIPFVMASWNEHGRKPI